MIFLKKLHGIMIFSVYSVEMVFLFPNDMTLPYCHKSKGNLLKKIHLKMRFPVSLKKMIFILENMVISSGRKIKDDEKVYSVKCS